MRNEDREAVRILMQRRVEEDSSSQKKEKKVGPSKKGEKKKWWQKLSDIDPISLEPLSELEYPPFELSTHYFDGRILAFYLVSTGTFVHPMSREELTLDQCKALDAYLRKNKLKAARVADAFSLQKKINADNSVQLIEQRRHATAILHGLFGFVRYGGASLRSGFDEDDQENTLEESTDEVKEDVSPVVVEQEEQQEEDFPALLDQDVEEATQIQARHQGNWRQNIDATAQNNIRDEDFPALGAYVPPQRTEVPRFRNALASYKVASHTAQSQSQAAGYAANAAMMRDFPTLPVTNRQQQKKKPKQLAGGPIVAQIRDVCGESCLASLREKSLEYRRGDLSAENFYASAQVLLGESFDDLFPGLVALLPDPTARSQLQSLITTKRLARVSPQLAVSPPLPPPPSPSITNAPLHASQNSPLNAPPRASDFPGLNSASVQQQPTKKKTNSGQKKQAAPGWQKALAQYSSTPGLKKKKSTGVSIVIPKNRPKQPPPPGASM
uniref:ZNF598/HEL2 PAH domain-containing protein n=1 Tax=Aureoumbra lagunensis TaxID=44058 RepID=A0A7S3JUB5_9STRA